MNKTKKIIEFGDFQTPKSLATEVLLTIGSLEEYESIIEPTCGIGAFLHACVDTDIPLSKLEGWEINPVYVKSANESLKYPNAGDYRVVREQDFFKIDWTNLKNNNEKQTLFIGNPPWVTNSELGRLLSKNIPEKYNFQDLTGLEAMTGKSNFDISEWILIQLLEFISGSSSSIAFLIKTSVARKLFQYITKKQILVSNLSIREIDAKEHFGVSVDACLFQAHGTKTLPDRYVCSVYSSLDEKIPNKIMGMTEQKLVSNVVAYEALSHIDQGSEFKWRSGVKHDASKIMEFDMQDNKLINGLSEVVDLPFEYLYPMYKSSHISKSHIGSPTKYMLVTQKKIGEETKQIEKSSPETWNYLLEHSEKLDGRKSSIYKNAPRFSVFGVGEYTFLPFKIVISGLYKNVIFSKISSYNDKPIIVDDTCYMLGFTSEKKADFILELITSEVCKEFIQSIIFLDNKRPITVALLNRINTKQIAKELGLLSKYQKILND